MSVPILFLVFLLVGIICVLGIVAATRNRTFGGDSSSTPGTSSGVHDSNPAHPMGSDGGTYDTGASIGETLSHAAADFSSSDNGSFSSSSDSGSTSSSGGA